MDHFSGEQKRTTAIVGVATFQLRFSKHPRPRLEDCLRNHLRELRSISGPSMHDSLQPPDTSREPVPEPLRDGTMFQIECSSDGEVRPLLIQ